VPDGEPWDMTSNVAAFAGESAASATAVREAMAQAGVTATSPVVLVGHSQGGLVAASIAATADYSVRGVVTFGAPTGLIDIPPDIPVLTVRHTDDIVPALGGYDTSTSALVVEREVFAGVPVPTDRIFPAHQLSAYRETAALIDDAKSAELRAALAALDDFAGADTGEVTTETTTYRARRAPTPR
jgi:pimeloyl-ACP methyl ester carboxylesterase